MIEIKEEFKKLIPALTAEEFKQLEENILKDGIRDPLVLWNGYLIDGHNRYQIAFKHGLEYKTIDKEFKDEDEVIIWMIDNQDGRRNLTDGWKYKLQQRKKEILLKKGKVKMSIGGELKEGLSTIDKPLPKHNTQKEIAKALDWSTGKVAMADIVFKKATPELEEKVLNNEVTINQAYQEIKKEELRVSKIDEINKTKSLDILEINEPLAIPYDENIFTLSNKKSEARFGDKEFSLKDNKYYTATTLERFFHKENGKEFSLREYAYVQTFDNDYKFIGTNQEIKKQIGNAVAPYMGEFITKHLKGKTCGDLFSGCGGFTSGAHRNKIKTLWAIEWEQIAAMTYKMNFPNTKVYNTNIKIVDPLMLDKVDIIIGGPPCQGFSNAGDKNIGKRTFESDPRNELYKEFLRFVNVLKPNEFIMENVKEIQDVAEQIIVDFNEIGYEIETKLIKGNDIGMKQNRIRFFFIGKLKT